MKKIVVFFLFTTAISLSQSSFNFEEYIQFLKANKNLDYEQLMSNYPISNPYYKGIENGQLLTETMYMDSIILKYELTEDELAKLKTNHFVISERLSHTNFGVALRDVHIKELPVFITSDMILHALHASYEELLWDVELKILKPKLTEILKLLYTAIPELVSNYETNPKLLNALEDVDLYITIAKSLLEENVVSPQYASVDLINTYWNAIQEEKYKEMPLFSERDRKLDFSQFIPRGHYTEVIESWEGEEYPLNSYFKCMMWLGRMDFFLTPPPQNPFEPPWEREEIRRMNLGAALVNELITISSSRSLLAEIDEIITFMVGESDNITPNEYGEIISTQAISSVDKLLNDSDYDNFQTALASSSEYGQKILSSIFIVDPFNSEAAQLPVSYRLLGQRFLIDSYIVSNIVYDKIIYDDVKIWRPMPDPMDILFVIGNENTLPLLESELENYKYSSQLSAMRYLVDAYDEEFWNVSLYNVWLQAIRELNPPVDRSGFPIFMKTAAWQQEKINTQLASWTQLRHDNILYAKQAYTPGGGCNFPHSYVEPYPKLYRQIGVFADKAGSYFSQITSDTCVNNYFSNLKELMIQLESLSKKELTGESFSIEEKEFLQQMLFSKEEYGIVYSGWFTDLFYKSRNTGDIDYLVVDIHTQPTDENGNEVGKIFHTGVGKINLGIFIAESPSNEYQSMAYVGPVMSYYEKITENFKRLTDEEWEESVWRNIIPNRPDWVNIYLTDKSGNAFEEGRELKSEVLTNIIDHTNKIPSQIRLHQNYPNPFNPSTKIKYSLPNVADANFASTTNTKLIVYDILGREVATLVNQKQNPGNYEVTWEASNQPSGVYFYQLSAGDFRETKKMILLR